MARSKPQSKRAPGPKIDLPGQADLVEAIALADRAIDAADAITTVDDILPSINGVVVEGEFAGQSTELALVALLDRVHEALSEASLQSAAAVVDMAMAEILIMNKLEYGPYHAREAALRFIATALPYVDMEELEDKPEKTFGEAILRIVK